MTTISANMLLRSNAPGCLPIKTMQVRYPHVIHAEHLRHRVFSFSVSSSRAISVRAMIDDVENDPFIPRVWRTAQRGMIAGAELTGADRVVVRDAYMRSLENAIREARAMAAHNAAKEIVNRILEPFSHVNVIMTATDWANFYALRRHPDAEPHMQELAERVYEADVRSHNQAQELLPGEWHLPLVTDEDRRRLRGMSREDRLRNLLLISAARCAGGSYRLRGTREKSIQEEVALGEGLFASRPLHASPFEHQATPDRKWFGLWWRNRKQHGNLTGWRQYRKMLPFECVEDDDQ